MYYYLYDSFVTERRYERELSAVESRLTDLGISGKVGRMTPFTNARGLVRDEVRSGTKTIVVVGNDETIIKVLDGVEGSGVSLGIIPIGEPNTLARAFGVPPGVDACDVLSRRVVKTVDLGRVNGQTFVSHVELPPGRYAIEGETSYRVKVAAAECRVVISNLRSTAVFGGEAATVPGDPQDGLLDALIVPSQEGILARLMRRAHPSSSVIRLKKVTIVGDGPIAAVADGGRRIGGERLIMEAVPGSIKVIVGKGRSFA